MSPRCKGRCFISSKPWQGRAAQGFCAQGRAGQGFIQDPTQVTQRQHHFQICPVVSEVQLSTSCSPDPGFDSKEKGRVCLHQCLTYGSCSQLTDPALKNNLVCAILAGMTSDSLNPGGVTGIKAVKKLKPNSPYQLTTLKLITEVENNTFH